MCMWAISAVEMQSGGLYQLGRSDLACEPLDLNPTIPATFNRNPWILIGRPLLIGPFGPSTVPFKSRPFKSDLAVRVWVGVVWVRLNPLCTLSPSRSLSLSLTGELKPTEALSHH